MKHYTNIILTIAALIVLAVAAGCVDSYTESGDTPAATASSSNSAKPSGAWTGNAKDFSYTTFAGMTGKASEFAGKPLVVNFWAAW